MSLDPKKQAEIKTLLGEKAALLIQEGMLVGLGSGSTAECFIKALGKRCVAGLKIQAVSSSERSTELAKSLGIECLDMNEVTEIDLTVDGADEVDPKRRLIKGGGGALLREKIVASSAKKMVVIVDENKMVKQLGACGLPIEILKFGATSTIFKLENLGFFGKLRPDKNGKPYITDNGNYIYDLHAPKYFSDPEKSHAQIKEVVGVVETGFFFNLASNVLVGYGDGSIKEF